MYASERLMITILFFILYIFCFLLERLQNDRLGILKASFL